MDTTDLIAIIGLIIFAVVFGSLTSRASQKREPLHGNQVARFFHFVACALMSVLTPSILTMVFIIRPVHLDIGGIHFSPIGQMLGIAVTIAVVAILCLIPFALLEKPAKEAWEQTQLDRGWTEKDARESGL